MARQSLNSINVHERFQKRNHQRIQFEFVISFHFTWICVDWLLETAYWTPKMLAAAKYLTILRFTKNPICVFRTSNYFIMRLLKRQDNRIMVVYVHQTVYCCLLAKSNTELQPISFGYLVVLFGLEQCCRSKQSGPLIKTFFHLIFVDVAEMSLFLTLNDNKQGKLFSLPFFVVYLQR